MIDMKEILLLKISDLPKYTTIKTDVEPNTVTPFIIMARDTKMTEMLGIKLLDKIMKDWEKDELSGDYKKIYDKYLVPALCYYTAYFMAVLHSVNISESGLHVFNTENGTSADLDDAEKIATRYIHLGDAVANNFKKEYKNIKLIELNTNCCKKEKNNIINWEF